MRSNVNSECWGRIDELDSLKNLVLDHNRAVALICGESGIGKTTLLNELENKLRRYPNVYTGLHEVDPGDNPLPHCLNKLADHIRGESRPAEAKAVLEGARQKFSLAELVLRTSGVAKRMCRCIQLYLIKPGTAGNCEESVPSAGKLSINYGRPLEGATQNAFKARTNSSKLHRFSALEFR